MPEYLGEKTEVPHYSKDINAIIEYISTNIDRQLNLTQIAKHVNLSKNYLCRLFKDQTGQSIFEYASNIRMLKAAELIKSSDIYIKEIASIVGINDSLYFTRMFKKQFGMSPSEYKKQY